MVSLKNKVMKLAKIVEIKTLKLSEFNEFMAHIDTGYSLDEFKKIVTRMYKHPDPLMDFILLKTIEEV